MIRERLGAKPIAVQLPIGSEADYRGAVDLFTEKAIVWGDEMVMEPEEVEVPPDLRNQVAEMRERMIEQIVETDDELTLKYLEGGEITPEELKEALRRAVLDNKATP